MGGGHVKAYDSVLRLQEMSRYGFLGYIWINVYDRDSAYICRSAYSNLMMPACQVGRKGI